MPISLTFFSHVVSPKCVPLSLFTRAHWFEKNRTVSVEGLLNGLGPASLPLVAPPDPIG